MTRSLRTKPLGRAVATVGAVAIVALALAPAAGHSAAGTGPPEASASASLGKQVKKVKRRVRKLSRQLRTLRRQVKALGDQQGVPGQSDDRAGGPPSGPAGGALTGEYPNPLLAAGAVNTAAIADDAVTAPKIADGTIDTPDLADESVTGAKVAPGSVTGTAITDLTIGAIDLADNSVNSAKIVDGSVGAAEIGDDAVGSSELVADSVETRHLRAGSVGGPKLATVTTRVSPPLQLVPGARGNRLVHCTGDRVLLAGGYAFTNDAPVHVISSAPDQDTPRTSWAVRAMVPANSVGNTLYVWATCLGV